MFFFWDKGSFFFLLIAFGENQTHGLCLLCDVHNIFWQCPRESYDGTKSSSQHPLSQPSSQDSVRAIT